MPIFEYICEGCGHKFEKLVRSSDEQMLTCPTCDSIKLKKVFSTFATTGNSSGSSSPANGCGG